MADVTRLRKLVAARLAAASRDGFTSVAVIDALTSFTSITVAPLTCFCTAWRGRAAARISAATPSASRT